MRMRKKIVAHILFAILAITTVLGVKANVNAAGMITDPGDPGDPGISAGMITDPDDPVSTDPDDPVSTDPDDPGDPGISESAQAWEGFSFDVSMYTGSDSSYSYIDIARYTDQIDADCYQIKIHYGNKESFLTTNYYPKSNNEYSTTWMQKDGKLHTTKSIYVGNIKDNRLVCTVTAFKDGISEGKIVEITHSRQSPNIQYCVNAGKINKKAIEIKFDGVDETDTYKLYISHRYENCIYKLDSLEYPYDCKEISQEDLDIDEDGYYTYIWDLSDSEIIDEDSYFVGVFVSSDNESYGNYGSSGLDHIAPIVNISIDEAFINEFSLSEEDVDSILDTVITTNVVYDISTYDFNSGAIPVGAKTRGITPYKDGEEIPVDKFIYKYNEDGHEVTEVYDYAGNYNIYGNDNFHLEEFVVPESDITISWVADTNKKQTIVDEYIYESYTDDDERICEREEVEVNSVAGRTYYVTNTVWDGIFINNVSFSYTKDGVNYENEAEHCGSGAWCFVVPEADGNITVRRDFELFPPDATTDTWVKYVPQGEHVSIAMDTGFLDHSINSFGEMPVEFDCTPMPGYRLDCITLEYTNTAGEIVENTYEFDAEGKCRFTTPSDVDNWETCRLYPQIKTTRLRAVDTTKVENCESITASVDSAAYGDFVSVNVVPQAGYKVKKLEVVLTDGMSSVSNLSQVNCIEASAEDNTYTYTFTMPAANVNVVPIMEKDESYTPEPEPTEPVNPEPKPETESDVISDIGSDKVEVDNSYDSVETFTRKVFNKDNVEITVKDVIYTGEFQRPAVKVSLIEDGKKTVLVEGTDYILTYENNKLASTEAKKAVVKIEGSGLYKGEAQKTFTVTPKSAKKLKYTADIVAVNMKADELNSKIAIYDGLTLLEEGKDYTLDIAKADVSKKGNAIVTAKTMGNYDGELTIKVPVVELKSDEKLITSAELKAGVSENLIYNGSAIKFTANQVVVKSGDEEITDFSITAKNTKDVGEGYLIIKGKKKVKGSVIVPVTIRPAKTTLTIDPIKNVDKITYNGKLQRPKVVVTTTIKDAKNMDKKVTLKLNKDYIVTYENNLNATVSENAVVKVTGIGNYAGVEVAKDATFTIKKLDIKKAKVVLNKDKTLKSVEYNKHQLVEGIDYEQKTVTDSKGKSKIEIKGLRNFEGTVLK